MVKNLKDAYISDLLREKWIWCHSEMHSYSDINKNINILNSHSMNNVGKNVEWQKPCTVETIGTYTDTGLFHEVYSGGSWADEVLSGEI